MATREEARRELARRELARRRGVPVSKVLEQIRQSGPKAKPQPSALSRFSRSAIAGGGQLADQLRNQQQALLGDFAAPIEPDRNLAALTEMGITDPEALKDPSFPATMGRQVAPSLAFGAMRPAAMGAELLAGAGGGAGQFAGRQVGGDVGGLVGGVAGSLTAAGAAAGIRGLAQRPGGAAQNLALREATGAPVALSEIGGSPLTQWIERAAAHLPGGSLKAQARATRIGLQISRRTEALAQKLTTSVDPELAGGAISKGFDSAVERFKTISEKLFTRTRGMIGGASRAPTSFAKALGKLQAEAGATTETAKAFGKGSSELIDDVTAKFSNEMQTGGGVFTGRQMDEIRRRLGADMSDIDIIGTPKEGVVKLLYGAITDDMRALAAKQGPKALRAFENANGFYKGNLEKINRINRSVVNKQTDSEIFSALFSRGQKGPEVLRDLRARIPHKEWDAAVGMVLKRMGRETPGSTTVTEAGEAGFSLNTFLTNWRKFNDAGTLKVLFEGKSPAMRGVFKDLNQIAKVAAGSRELTKVLGNPSRSGEMAFAGTALTTGAASALGVGAGVVDVMTAVPLASMVVGSPIGVQMLVESPKFIGWLAQSTRIPLGQLPAHIERLEKVIEEEPQARPLAQAVVEGFKP